MSTFHLVIFCHCSCHIMLQSLSYCVEIDEHFTLHNYHGKEEAVMRVKIFPLNDKGEYLGDESIVEPRELLGKPFNFEISIPECMGVRWCSEDRSRGVYCKYVSLVSLVSVEDFINSDDWDSKFV